MRKQWFVFERRRTFSCSKIIPYVDMKSKHPKLSKYKTASVSTCVKNFKRKSPSMTLPFLRCQAAIILYISKPIKPWSSVSDYSFALNRRRTLFRNQTAIFLHSETKYNHNEVIWVIKFCNHHKTHLQSVSVHWCFKDTPWNLTKYKNKYQYKFLKGFK